jgi:ubiquinone/menaquinone biosynthesis C-methylase UbiE
VRQVALFTHSVALPFAANSLDLVVLPHTLELSLDPHATLREVERVLVPEGRVVISGLNPASLWGLRQQRARIFRRFGVGEGETAQKESEDGQNKAVQGRQHARNLRRGQRR